MLRVILIFIFWGWEGGRDHLLSNWVIPIATPNEPLPPWVCLNLGWTCHIVFPGPNVLPHSRIAGQQDSKSSRTAGKQGGRMPGAAWEVQDGLSS